MSSQDADQALLNAIVERIHEGDTLSEVIPQVMPNLLIFLRSERVTIYQKTRDDTEIVSRFKVQDDVDEIRVPLSTTSLSGYVALTQRPLAIMDVNDAKELAKHNPNLRFDTSFDRRSGFTTRNMLVLPIKYKDVLVGVLQAINRTGGRNGYTANDLRRATVLARLLGQKLRYELTLTSGPFEYLVQSNLVTRDKLGELVARSESTGTTVSSLLVTECHVLPMEVGESLERYYQTPYMAFDPQHVLPVELMAGLKHQYLRQRMWIPVDGDQDEAVVLLDDPADNQRIQEIQGILNARDYRFRVGLPEDILAFLGDRIPFYEHEVEVGNTNVRELSQGLAREAALARTDKENAAAILARGAAAIVDLLDRVIYDAFQQRASDIHIEPGKDEDPTLIRYRIDGACHQMYRVPAAFSSALLSRLKVVSQLDISERRRPQDGKLILDAGDSKIELRVAVLPTVNGESAVLRILARSKPLPLSKLNVSEANLERLQQIVEQPHGFLLAVGPTGSGKTTTLHAILRHINTPDKKIWTAEDPVEITQPGMQQMQIRHKIGVDFAAALRSFLRADPDIIMIGEMRDRETASAMVEASLTGHLVFSTLHTNSAPETVIRLLGLGIEPAHFVDAFRGVIAQRLVRTLCDKCKYGYKPDEAEIRQIRAYYGAEHLDELGIDWDTLELYRADGCERCHGSGYRGRIAIHELLSASAELNEAIYAGKTGAAELFQIGVRTGMRTLMQDGIVKMFQGYFDFTQLKKVVVT